MANRYWVGGTGDWTPTNTANWSTTSGGPGGASVPSGTFSHGDDVIFDANSGGGVVNLVAAATSGYIRSFNSTGFTGSFTSADGVILRPLFSFVLNRPWVSTSSLYLQAVGGTINISVPTTFNIALGISGLSANFSIVSDLVCNSLSQNNSNTSYTYNLTLDCDNITCAGNIGIARCAALRPCLLTGSAVNLVQNAQNVISVLSQSRLSFRVKTGLSGTLVDQAFDKLFLDPAPGAVIDILRRGSWNLIKNVNANAFTLRLPQAFWLSVVDWQVFGNPGGRVTLTTDGAQVCSLSGGGTLEDPVAADYLNINKIHVSPANVWYAGSNSTDHGQNSGWVWGDAPTSDSNQLNNSLFFASL